MIEKEISISDAEKAQKALIHLCKMPPQQLKYSPVAKVDNLIQKGASFIRKGENGFIPIELAVIAGNEAMFSLFVARGGNVNKYPTLLFYSNICGQGSLFQQIYEMSSWRMKLKAKRIAYKKEMIKEYENNKFIFCSSFSKRSWIETERAKYEMLSQVISLPLKKTLEDYFYAYFSLSSMKRKQYQDLLSIKTAMKKSLLIGQGDYLVPLFLDAVNKKKVLVIDYLYTYGDIFLVSEKAFKSVPSDKEDAFMENWLYVTDEVSKLRQRRQKQQIKKRNTTCKKFIRRLLRRIKKSRRERFYTQTKTVPIRRIKIVPLDPETKVQKDVENLCLPSEQKQKMIFLSKDKER